MCKSQHLELNCLETANKFNKLIVLVLIGTVMVSVGLYTGNLLPSIGAMLKPLNPNGILAKTHYWTGLIARSV